MASTRINATAFAAPNALSSSCAPTFPATGAGNALIVAAAIYTTNVPTISGAGGSWALVFTSGVHRAWVNLSPTTSSTTITVGNTGTNSDFSVDILEFSGLKAAGSSFASTINSQASVTAWTGNAINPGVSVLAVGVSGQVTLDTITSTAGTGFTLATRAANGSQGAALVTVSGDFAPGSISGAGTWSSTCSPGSYTIGFELAPASTANQTTSNMLLLAA